MVYFNLNLDKNIKRKNNSSRENNIVKMKIMFGLVLVMIKFGLVYFFYQDYLTNLVHFNKVFNITSQEQIYYLFLQNLQREYFFDPQNATVWNYPAGVLFNNTLEEVYDFKESKNNVKKIIIFRYQANMRATSLLII